MPDEHQPRNQGDRAGTRIDIAEANNYVSTTGSEIHQRILGIPEEARKATHPRSVQPLPLPTTARPCKLASEPALLGNDPTDELKTNSSGSSARAQAGSTQSKPPARKNYPRNPSTGTIPPSPLPLPHANPSPNYPPSADWVAHHSHSAAMLGSTRARRPWRDTCTCARRSG